MRAVTQEILGELNGTGEHGVLILDSGRQPVYLRFALVEQSAGNLIFPELLMDDWGHELKSLDLYLWIRDNGIRFPRAEVFGYDGRGNNRQYFLRELDLLAKYPCFGSTRIETLAEDSMEIDTIVLAVDEPLPAESNPVIGAIDWPLRNAAVDWWRVDSRNATDLSHSLLVEKSNNQDHSVNTLKRPN